MVKITKRIRGGRVSVKTKKLRGSGDQEEGEEEFRLAA